MRLGSRDVRPIDASRRSSGGDHAWIDITLEEVSHVTIVGSGERLSYHNRQRITLEEVSHVTIVGNCVKLSYHDRQRIRLEEVSHVTIVDKGVRLSYHNRQRITLEPRYHSRQWCGVRLP